MISYNLNMLKTIKHDSKTILNKKFETKINGYDPQDVDKYLDEIISDYVGYEKYFDVSTNKFHFQKKLLEDYQLEIESLKEEIINLKNQINIIEKKDNSNKALIARINKLENKVSKK